MTNLTDKLKKGELPKNFYYVDVPEGSPIAYGNENYIEIETPEFGYLFYIEGEESKLPDYVKVLAEVPSYEEYLSLTYAKEEDERIIAEYEAENTKLKELLKQCCYRIDWTAKTGYKLEDDRKQKLFNDIEEVLKENNNA